MGGNPIPQQPGANWSVVTLLVAAACGFALALLVLGVWQLQSIRQGEIESRERGARQVAVDRRNNVDTALTHYIAALEMLSNSALIDEGRYRQLHAQTKRVLDPLGVFALMRTTDGQQLFNTRIPFGTALPRETGFDDPVMTTRAPYVSDLVIGAVAQSPVVGLSVPVLREGDVTSILTVSIEPVVLERMLLGQSLPEGMHVDLLDRRGVLIASTEDSVAAETLLSPNRPIQADGWVEIDDTMQVARSRIAEWFIVTRFSQPGFFSWALATYLIGWVGVVTLAVMLAAFLGLHIVRTAHAVVGAAGRLARREPVEPFSTGIKEGDRLVAALVDVSHQHQQHEAEMELVVGEASHRLKNVLSLIAAIVSQSEGETTDALKQNISHRIQAMGAAQDVLTGRQKEADLRALVERQLSVMVPSGRPGVSVDGVAVSLSAQATQMIGLALHELATNAVKHGALSVESGSLSIRWKVESDSLIMEWIERGGPAVTEPTRTGYGFKVIKAALERSFAAEVELTYGQHGFSWTARFDLSSIAPTT